MKTNIKVKRSHRGGMFIQQFADPSTPGVFPHLSGRWLGQAINICQAKYLAETKATPSRNKREGWYMGWLQGCKVRTKYQQDSLRRYLKRK